MSRMKSGPLQPVPKPSGTSPGRGFETVFLRLVKGGPERQAIEAGQIDAIVDAETGNAILLPEAQRSLIERKAHFRDLVALCADWHWQQDEHCRFVAGESAGGERPRFDLAQVIGKALWELPFDNMSEDDWRTHRTQLQWRAAFHDLELRDRDHAGAERWISVDGEPVFDAAEQFKGYRGTARDITGRKQAQALLQGSNRHARSALDALAAQVCVLDPEGTVIMANKAWRASAAAGEGISAGVPERANYLAVCDNAAGNERADGMAIAAGIRQVIGEQGSLFRHQAACDSPAGRRRLVLTIAGYREDGEARALVSRESMPEHEAEKQPLQPEDYAAADPVRAARAKPAAKAPNSLLASLPAGEYQRLLAGLEPVTLTYGEVLYEPGTPIRHVYFPTGCLVSLLTTVTGRHALEVGLVGREGMVGIALALGIDVSPARALVQASGSALRMEAARFRDDFLQSMPLQQALYRYTHALMVQIAQTAACNQFHVIEERLARWLTMTRDRVRSNEFRLTHGFLADMLGVRRSGVTEAAGRLQAEGLIEYQHGRITVLDRKRLAAACCECYRIVKRVYDSAA